MSWLPMQKLINGDDDEATVAYYCLHRFHWKPSEYLSLPMREKAFVIAAIDIRVEAEKKK